MNLQDFVEGVHQRYQTTVKPLIEEGLIGPAYGQMRDVFDILWERSGDIARTSSGLNTLVGSHMLCADLQKGFEPEAAMEQFETYMGQLRMRLDC
jgi:hypothetical protein